MLKKVGRGATSEEGRKGKDERRKAKRKRKEQFQFKQISHASKRAEPVPKKGPVRMTFCEGWLWCVSVGDGLT